MAIQNYSIAKLVEFVQTLLLFSDVSMAELSALIEKGNILHFKKGALICREGQEPDAFYVILQGMVNVSKISLGGKEFTIDCRFKGDTLGWGQVLRGGSYTATYYAMDETVLLSFGKEMFIAFLNRNPIVQFRSSNQVIDLVNTLYSKLFDIACDTANNRLIGTLISLNKKCGNTINLTHLDLAKMSWTTLETVTRVLTKLKKDGILSTDRGKIILKAPDKLYLYIHHQK